MQWAHIVTFHTIRMFANLQVNGPGQDSQRQVGRHGVSTGARNNISLLKIK